jgi:hypothetical protein
MTAMRPNMNFDNEHKEHVPYQNKKPIDMKAAYERIMKGTGSAESVRPRAIRNEQAYNKWFKTQ